MITQYFIFFPISLVFRHVLRNRSLPSSGILISRQSWVRASVISRLALNRVLNRKPPKVDTRESYLPQITSRETKFLSVQNRSHRQRKLPECLLIYSNVEDLWINTWAAAASLSTFPNLAGRITFSKVTAQIRSSPWLREDSAPMQLPNHVYKNGRRPPRPPPFSTVHPCLQGRCASQSWRHGRSILMDKVVTILRIVIASFQVKRMSSWILVNSRLPTGLHLQLNKFLPQRLLRQFNV